MEKRTTEIIIFNEVASCEVREKKRVNIVQHGGVCGPIPPAVDVMAGAVRLGLI